MFLKNSKFICPVCEGKLFNIGTSLKCLKAHSFDISKQGYVNLLMKNDSGRHGDDKLMLNARKNFFDKGYYAPLRDAVCEILGKEQTVLDSGCGEGYYTASFAEHNTVYGIDISKDALKMAAARCKSSEFAVASINAIPLPDSSVDAVVNIFAPESLNEFSRVLTSGGRYITAVPLEKHLFNLKKAVYDKPYLNPTPITEKAGFELLGSKEVKYEISLDNQEDIHRLFMMTPYYYKTSREDQEKLKNISKLSVEAEFLVIEYKATK